MNPAASQLHRGWLHLALLPVIAIGCWGAPLVPARAQTATEQQLMYQLNQMRQELRALQTQVYSGGTGGGSASLSNSAAADIQVRLSQLERDQQGLTGQIEQLGHQIRQIGERLDRLASDVEYRLQALEGGTAAPRQQGAAPQTQAPQTQAPQTQAPQTQAPQTQAPQTQAPQTQASQTMAPSSSATQMVPGEEPKQLGTITSGTSTAATGVRLPGGTAEESYQYAFGLMRQSKFDEAEAAFKAFLAKYPNDPLAGNAQYWLGETYYARGDYSQAAVAFAEGYQDYPNSRKAPDNVLKLAKSLAQLGRSSDACAALSELPRQMPNAPPQTLQKAQEERQRLGCP
jgi:tol-pal system protein YbgF